MRITEKDVEQLATVSRLELTDEDKAACAESLNASLDYMDTLKKLDTGDVEPAAHVLPIKNVFREDTVQASLEKEIALANAPETEEGSFKVPRIV
ncbi:MAG: Asp-tRNA(Asn)/Glu-tRNA(Gln) amidotransferase subunit GatC [Clostridia bacterium]|jgi:aspartyl-tRNA(Asn)/glutamyl-tRNA(Gln) amidotransferase subunit C|nr:Asp-tRNA(Asn)/Glu-tRNA(Gln) amidotransferase subunit GatC [Clostridia bacterium]